MQQYVFSYHKKLAEHFKKQSKTWNWFAQTKVQQEQVADFKKNLLKNTYRLSPDSESKIYDQIALAKEKLGIREPVTVYQELDSFQTNASVVYLDGEINIVVSGKLLSELNEKEQLVVFAHELTHVLFYQLDNADYEITSRIIRSIANDTRSSTEMSETARLYQLYTELFCDRGSLQVVEDLDIVIETFVKVSTGLPSVSAKNYLKQAKEIFSDENVGTQQLTHPETFIRARALEIFYKKEDETQIPKMIDAQWGLNKLDIFKQDELLKITEKVLRLITKPKWMQNENTLALCRQYFPTFNFSNNELIDDALEDFFDHVDDTIREYLSYVFMDFCFVDSSLESAPIGHVFQIAEALHFHKTFRQVLKKETKLTVKKLDAMIAKAINEVSQLSESEDESILTDQ